MEKVDISNVIRNIFNERGYEIIKTPKVFCSIVDDLAFDAQKERVILRRVLTISPEICNKIFILLSTEDAITEDEMNKLIYELGEVYGVSGQWIQIVLKMLFYPVKNNTLTPEPISIEEKNKTYSGENDKEDSILNNKRSKCNNGDTYIGEFINGQFTGSGKLIRKGGDVLEGYFENGVLNGMGKKTSSSGSVFIGSFKNNKLHGQGRIEFKSGNIYEGHFQNGRLDGEGSIKSPQGKYSGHFKCGKYDGRGVFVWENGDRFEGMFVEGVCKGKGHFIGQLASFDGEIINSDSEKLKIFGIWKTKNHTVYEGEIIPTPHYKVDSLDCIRDLVNGNAAFSFNGCITWPDGKTFKGDCSNLKPYDGKGVWHSSYGNIFDRVEKGKWKEGTKKRF